MASIVPQGIIDLDTRFLPFYTLRSCIRMFAAFGLSVVFTLVYGYIASHNRLAEVILIPLLDILQSVPVLGFLSVSVASFASLFPGSSLGFELSSIFAIFTSQAWNMTFAFYQSLISVPKDLREAASILGLTRWQVFKKLELPYSMISLVWNGMMSFGGGWFFLAASEAITVLGKNVRLPGIGSYMAQAIETSNARALFFALVSMVITIVALDQLFWRPFVAWSRKFKVELTSEGDESESFILDLASRSFVLQGFNQVILNPVLRGLSYAGSLLNNLISHASRTLEKAEKLITLINYSLWFLVLGYAVSRLFSFLSNLSGSITLTMVGQTLYLGFLTFLRVMASVFLGLLWTVPVGVKIGTTPALRRVLQPVVQIAASFPANMLFPYMTMLYLRYHVNLQIGAIPLMMLGTQWYLLFNVIGGSMAIPNDLKEAAALYGLKGYQKWKQFILPSIFPSIVTGAVTAAGGAWNASIVAEVTSWGKTTMVASGLGSFIAESTSKGDWGAIVTGILTMSAIVVLVNRFFWRRLWKAAEDLKASFQ